MNSRYSQFALPLLSLSLECGVVTFLPASAPFEWVYFRGGSGAIGSHLRVVVGGGGGGARRRMIGHPVRRKDRKVESGWVYISVDHYSGQGKGRGTSL